MSVLAVGSVRRRGAFALQVVAFFVLLYLYVWLRIEPGLLYFRVAPWFPHFRLGLPFFLEFAAYPGGIVEYVSALLSQFYYYPWIGALVLTVVGALLCLGARVLIGAAGGVRPGVVHLLSAVLLLVLCSRYAHHLATSLALVTAVAGVCVYTAIPWRRGASRAALFLGLCAPLYYLAGGAYLLYAALCALHELVRKRWHLGALCLACGLVVPYALGTCLFRTRTIDTYGRLLPFHPEVEPIALGLAVGLYAFFPLAALGAAARRWLKKVQTPEPEESSGTGGGAGAGCPPEAETRPLLASAALWVTAVAAALLSFDGDFKRVLQVEYYAHRRMWPQVLETARLVPRRHYDLVVYLTVNWALYHEGRLPHDLLRYAQHRGSLLRAPEEFIPPAGGEYTGPSPLTYMRLSDIYLDLGRVNESEHMAHEALEGQGPRPWILERIALVNIGKGRTGVARTFLRALEGDLVYGKWARQRLRRLEADPSLSADEEVARLRRFRPQHAGRGERSIDGMLRALLAKNGRNRMAFEYLMAYYLLTGNLEGVVGKLERVRGLGYSSTPRNYEEAAALYAAISGRSVGAPAASEETVRRLRQFEQALLRQGGDSRAACRALAKDYGDSYFLYYTCYLAPGSGQ